MIASTVLSLARWFAPTLLLLAIAACSDDGAVSGSGGSTGLGSGAVSGNPAGGSVIGSGATSGTALGASGTAASGFSALSTDAGDLSEVGSDASLPATAEGGGSSGSVSSNSDSSSGSGSGADDVDGAAVDPWAGDPFADVAPPSEPADASYTGPANDSGAVTWANWVSGFSNVYCVSCHSPQAPCGGSGCHVPSDPQVYALSFDMREKSSWTARAPTIQCGIVATQDPSSTCNVPPETYPKMVAGYPLPTDEERAVVANWIEAGCP